MFTEQTIFIGLSSDNGNMWPVPDLMPSSSFKDRGMTVPVSEDSPPGAIKVLGADIHPPSWCWMAVARVRERPAADSRDCHTFKGGPPH